MPHHKQNIDETAGSAVQPSITGSEPALDTEAALRESEQKYRVLSTLPTGITISDPSGEILESNARAVELLGIPKDEHELAALTGNSGTSFVQTEPHACRRICQRAGLKETVRLKMSKWEL